MASAVAAPACALISRDDYNARLDLDGDGIPRPTDCDDNDPNIGAPSGLFVDEDKDGYGGTAPATTCALGDGVSAVSGDCNDVDPTIRPGATEVCNGLDDDCDGVADNGVEPQTWYFDGDSDGYGTPFTTIVQCTQPAGYVANGSDCNDADPSVNPDTLWYPDSDGDGYGDESRPTASCEQPAGSIRDGTDCDDTRADVSPTGLEVCDAGCTGNGCDEDCDGLVDDADPSATGQTLWYRDADGDGLGTVFTTVEACDQPDGYVSDRTDCDDGNVDATASADCRWVEVSTLGFHTCALRANGLAQCWGSDSDGQSDAPTDVFTTVSAGYNFSCGVRLDGSITCWGTDDYHEVDSAPTGVFASVSTGSQFGCALSADGTPTCWPAEGYGRYVPVHSGFVRLSAGNYAACTLDADGAVGAWGGSGAEVGTFVKVAGGYEGCLTLDRAGSLKMSDGHGGTPPSGAFSSITWGFNHGCAIADDGTTLCWGQDDYGDTAVPDGEFASVSAGQYHTCAITTDGFLQCWGDDTYGQTDAPTD